MGGKTWLRWPWRGKAFVADPEEAMFAHLFRHLLFWYIGILTVVAALLTLSIGSTVPWLVFASVEHALSGQVSQLAQTWQNTPGSGCPFTSPAQGYLLACYDAQGRLVRSFGKATTSDKHFQENSLVLAALHEHSATQDALDETGIEKLQFSFVVFASARPDIVRQAVAVRKPGSKQILGVVQLGTTPAETLAQRQVIVNIFFTCMFLLIMLGVPGGGWYLASKALLPAKLAFQRQRDFVANASHELGTSLALLRANADVLLRGRERLLEDDALLLEDIVEETAYLDKMTGHMLLLARMDAGHLHLEQEKINLGQIAQGVVRRAQALAKQAKITLTFQQKEEAYAQGDRVQLEQVTLILLDNALKYTQPGGRVNVSIFLEKGCPCLRVSDTGIGIMPADLERLGERFYRVDKARSREAGGQGLGLSIARGVAAVHKGKLTLTSEFGQGTEATLLLPPIH